MGPDDRQPIPCVLRLTLAQRLYVQRAGKGDLAEGVYFLLQVFWELEQLMAEAGSEQQFVKRVDAMMSRSK